MSGNITLSQIASPNCQLRLIRPTFCYPAFARPPCFTCSRRRYDISLRGSAVLSHAGDCGTSVRSWVQRPDWKWQQRISGPVEEESVLPAVENQLVSKPASPAPSVSHLLEPQGGLANLSASHSSQRLCHARLVVPYFISRSHGQCYQNKCPTCTNWL